MHRVGSFTENTSTGAVGYTPKMAGLGSSLAYSASSNNATRLLNNQYQEHSSDMGSI